MSRPRPALVHVGLIGALALAPGCGKKKSAHDDAAHEAAKPPAKAEAPEKADPAGKADGIAATFDRLEKVAGRGDVETEGANSWKPEFEGKPALNVELSRPYFAVADGHGRVFIADKEAHAVRVVAPDGTISTLAGGAEPGDDGDGPGPAAKMRLAAPNGLKLVTDGTLFVLDRDNGKIRRIAFDGPEPTMTTLLSVPGGIETGRGLWVADDAQRAYFSSKHELKEWTTNGGVRVLSDGFVSLGNLEVDTDGTVIAADRGGNRVYRVAADGTKTAIAGNGDETGGGDGAAALETGLHGARGVARDPSTGGLFIATQEGSGLWFLDPKGQLQLVLDASPDRAVPFDTADHVLRRPRGVSIAPGGDLILTADDAGFVYRLTRRRD